MRHMLLHAPVGIVPVVHRTALWTRKDFPAAGGGRTLEHSCTKRQAAPEKLLLARRRSVSAVSGLSASRGPLAPKALKFRDATRPSAEQVTPSQLERATPLLQAASPDQVSRGLRLFAGTCAITGLSAYRPRHA